MAPPAARHKRESVAVLAQSNTVKNRLAQWVQKTGSSDGGGAPAPMPGRAPPTFGRSAAGAPPPMVGQGSAPKRHHARAVAAAPRLDAIAENEATAAEPSPATKQALAERRDSNRFPSIIFTGPGHSSGGAGAPPPLARIPLPGAVAVLPPVPAAAKLRPATAPPPSGPPDVVPTRAATAPLPAVAIEESSAEHFDDAYSAPSAEGSGGGKTGSWPLMNRKCWCTTLLGQLLTCAPIWPLFPMQPGMMRLRHRL